METILVYVHNLWQINFNLDIQLCNNKKTLIFLEMLKLVYCV